MSGKTGGYASGATRDSAPACDSVDEDGAALDLVRAAGPRNHVRAANLDAAIPSQGDLGLSAFDHQLLSGLDAELLTLLFGAASRVVDTCWGRLEQTEHDGLRLFAVQKADENACADAIAPLRRA